MVALPRRIWLSQLPISHARQRLIKDVYAMATPTALLYGTQHRRRQTYLGLPVRSRVACSVS